MTLTGPTPRWELDASEQWWYYRKANGRVVRMRGDEATCDTCGKKYPRIRRARKTKNCFCGLGCVPSGSDSFNWRGGRSTDSKGYIRVWVGPHKNGHKPAYAHEHRLVMERMLGRALQSWEQVHHINGDKHDNRPENLQLIMEKGHLSGQAMRCADCGSEHLEAVPFSTPTGEKLAGVP